MIYLRSSTAATWGQQDLPVTATVVFSPGDSVDTANLRDGDVTGIDVNGRAVNSASFSGTGQRGWKIATSEYDAVGNVIRTLTPGNRDRAVYDTANTITSLGCPCCSGRMKLLALVTDPTSVARYLRGIGEPTDVPKRTPARGPPYWASRVLRRGAGSVEAAE